VGCGRVSRPDSVLGLAGRCGLGGTFQAPSTAARFGFSGRTFLPGHQGSPDLVEAVGVEAVGVTANATWRDHADPPACSAAPGN
jgi:hypothetical protein